MNTISETYTIRLCNNGKQFKSIPNVVDDFRPRPKAGDIIDEKWKVLGVIYSSAKEIVVDVEEAAGHANTTR